MHKFPKLIITIKVNGNRIRAYSVEIYVESCHLAIYNLWSTRIPYRILSQGEKISYSLQYIYQNSTVAFRG